MIVSVTLLMSDKLREHALALMTALIREAKRRNVTRLPPVRTIARVSGISNRTLIPVIRRLAGRGVLSVIPGKGTFVAEGEVTAARSTLKSDASVRSMAERMFREVPARRRGRSPAFDRAVKTIRRLAETPAKDGRLPPVRVIAQTADVCQDTGRRAVSFLSRHGEVVARQGRGVFVSRSAAGEGGEITEPVSDSAPRRLAVPKWVSLREAILRDIADGKYRGTSALPPMKHLVHSYGTSYRPLHAALESLERDKHLERFKRTYRVPRLAGDSLASIVLCIDTPPRVDMFLVNPQLLEAIRMFEKECHERNLSLCMVPLMESRGTARPFDRLGLERIVARRSVLGFCFWSSRAFDDEFLIPRLARFNRPIAVIDDVGEVPAERLCRLSGLVTVFKLGTGELGPRRVAEYLVRLGHLRATYFSQYRDMVWSATRYASLERAFARDRSGARMSAYGIDSPENRLSFSMDITPGRYRRHLPPLFLKRMHGLVERQLLHTPDVRREVSDMFGLFDRALEEDTATAWVTSEDETAFFALRHLRDRGVRVPEEISLISFDNTPDSNVGNITSYDFNMDAIVHRITDCFLMPRKPGHPPPGRRIVEVEGSIMERDTTGRPPSAE